MKTRGAVIAEVGRGDRGFEIWDMELAEPRAGEALVRVAAAGVCHSDWHVASGATKHALPVVGGHEGAGVVEAVGADVTAIAPGDHVALNWAPTCGACFYCTHDRPALCKTYVEPIWAGTMMDGTTRLSRDGEPVYAFSALGCFAERIVVPVSCCVKLPADVPPEIAALIGCAVTTGVGAVVNTARVQAGQSAAVYGVGGVGLSAIMGAAAAGCAAVIAVDRTLEKAQLAESMGATHAFAIDTPGLEGKLRDLTGGRGVDHAFDTTGLPDVQTAAYRVLRPGGQLTLIGLGGADATLALPAADMVRTEKTVAGCYYGSSDAARDFTRFADWYRAGRLPLDRLVSRRYTLDQINEAYDAMLAGQTARGVIVFD